MKRVKFLNELEIELNAMGVKEIDSIIRDYEELFIEGMKRGLDEEQIINNLESPKDIAATYAKSKDINIKLDKKVSNSKIKELESMRALWFVVIGITTVLAILSLFSGAILLTLLFVLVDVGLGFLIGSITRDLDQEKAKEKKLNNIAKDDLGGDDE